MSNVATELRMIIGLLKRAIDACMVLAVLAITVLPAGAKGYCAANSGATAVDLSDRVDLKFLEEMRRVGVKTIIRYYDHENETIARKTLRRKERDLIIANGFNIAVVFQHNNDKFASFTSARGRQDAERSLLLAAENSQPKGSAIYFGVDGGWKQAGELANIKEYFKAVRARLEGTGYRIGVYGSGLICRNLINGGLAELCWLASAKWWPQYNDYYNTGKWKLLQMLPVECGGRNVDFNLSNTADPDYGQFMQGLGCSPRARCNVLGR
jgi:hypothetical protein